MKKLIFTLWVLMIHNTSLLAQPISSAAVAPVSATLSSVLRLNITNGGNIEFVFNTINQYKNGLGRSVLPGSGDFYTTRFTVSSATNWQLLLGAEDATLIGTDNALNVLGLTNIGFRIVESGANTCCLAGDEITSLGGNHLAPDPGGFATAIPNGLSPYTGAGPIVITTGTAVNGNTGVEADNVFEINWECGTTLTTGATAMNTSTLLNLSVAPDRYMTNVFLDINGI